MTDWMMWWLMWFSSYFRIAPHPVTWSNDPEYVKYLRRCTGVRVSASSSCLTLTFSFNVFHLWVTAVKFSSSCAFHLRWEAGISVSFVSLEIRCTHCTVKLLAVDMCLSGQVSLGWFSNLLCWRCDIIQSFKFRLLKYYKLKLCPNSGGASFEGCDLCGLRRWLLRTATGGWYISG